MTMALTILDLELIEGLHLRSTGTEYPVVVRSTVLCKGSESSRLGL